MTTAITTHQVQSFNPSPFKAILATALAAGTLDIIAAIASVSIKAGDLRVVPVLKYIASGVFGRDAMKGGTEMVLSGLLFHYLIALVFTVIFFLLYPRWPFLQKHTITSGLVYGVVVWVIMNRVVLPLSRIPTGPFKINAWMLLQVGILMCCIGLPISLLIGRYYSKRKLHSID